MSSLRDSGFKRRDDYTTMTTQKGIGQSSRNSTEFVIVSHNTPTETKKVSLNEATL